MSENGGVLEVVNPFDLKVIGSVPVNSAQEVEGFIAKADQLFKDPDQWISIRSCAAIH